jgi:uncharacterized protein
MSHAKESIAYRELERLLTRGDLTAPQYEVTAVRCETVMVVMRDGVRLATDVYLPPIMPAPVVAMRTPYGRATDNNVAAFLAFARRGYAVVSQDCRGTGGSEPDHWDYYMFESDDGYDCVEWINRQPWYGGFIGACGGSYVGQTQWCMATHPAMSTIAPWVSGLGFGFETALKYMFSNAYSRTMGKGEGNLSIPIYEIERHFEKETMAEGYFNQPLYPPFSAALLAQCPELARMAPAEAQRSLWERYCDMACVQRADFVKRATGATRVTSAVVKSLSAIFGFRISPDALTLPHSSQSELCRLIRAPPLIYTGWYDWCLNDAFETWALLRREGHPEVASRARMIITPYAHNMPGYHENSEAHVELSRVPSVVNQVPVLLHWYAAMRDRKTDEWPAVIYYLMGANEWRSASEWPVPQAKQLTLFLGDGETLCNELPRQASGPDSYTYDPHDPTPTVGGSIVSWVYPPGSVDVSRVQQREDVLVYSTPVLERDLDVVGPVQVVLYASSSAVDTDFVARLSDVFPDGRAIQIQSGLLRTRYRNLEGDPELLEPNRVYRLKIDLWHTANRFKAGHRLRVDISSADFPHYDRNSNLGGEPGEPISAQQRIYRDPQRPSHLLISVLTA